MKTTKYLLLIIGILGITASIYGLMIDKSLSNNLIGFICGASLIYGYFEFNKLDKK